jgi:branched-chain amino acid transport system substrate-binding protein
VLWIGAEDAILKSQRNDRPGHCRSLLYGLLGAAAAGVSTRRASAASEPIRIGWLTALTGPSSAGGIGFNRGVVHAANKINAAGGVNGRMIEVITHDPQGDPAKAMNAAVELASSLKVHASLGPTNSGESLATTPTFFIFRISMQ